MRTVSRLALGAALLLSAGCSTLQGLIPGREYCMVVRARDEAGNWDTNTEVACVTTPTQTCIDYESVVQPLFDERCTQCHGGRNPPRELRLTSYDELVEGAIRGAVMTPCDPEASLLVQKVSPDAGAGHTLPLDVGLDAVEWATLERWIEEGARAVCPMDEGPDEAVCP